MHIYFFSSSLVKYIYFAGQLLTQSSSYTRYSARGDGKGERILPYLVVYFCNSGGLDVQWATKVLRHCHIGVLKVNFFPHLYNTTPSPLFNVGFPVSWIWICLFPVQHWNWGGGVSSQSKPDMKQNKWNVAVSTQFSQLSRLLLSPIVDLPPFWAMLSLAVRLLDNGSCLWIWQTHKIW